jgi:restriction endonuclease-like protein
MLGSIPILRAFPYAAALRQELSARNRAYAQRLGLECRESRGDPPVTCYLPGEGAHGNFLPETYQAIQQNPEWRRRLSKPHTSARSILPREGYRWHELDSSTSSDALLMNIFCYPGTLRRHPLLALLGLSEPAAPRFGIPARVPLLNGRFDRTEVDMRLADLLVEAKLTEAGFQTKSTAVVDGYRDFAAVFDRHNLPKDKERYISYQLIRNVLAAYASSSSLCVMMDARRPDLREAWYAIMSCVRVHELRLRCRTVTWQELAAVLPSKLQSFLEEKYGIVTGNGSCHG